MSHGFELALCVLTTLAAASDARTGRIPNGLTLPVLAGAPFVHAVLGGPEGAVVSVVGLVAGALPPLAVFRMGGIGGGDVKLFAAAGALVGPVRGLEVQMAAYVVTAVIAMLVLWRRGRLAVTLRRSVHVLRRRGADGMDAPVETMRLGVPVLVAVLVTVPRRAFGL